MQRRNVGIGELGINADPQVLLTAVGLGSCVAVAFYHPEPAVAAVLHVMLPRAPKAEEGARVLRYADPGIPFALRQLESWGVSRRRLRAAIAGGASMFRFGPASHITIGQDNLAAVEGILERLGIPVLADDTGGEQSRTLVLDVATGQARVWTTAASERVLAELGAGAAAEGCRARVA